MKTTLEASHAIIEDLEFKIEEQREKNEELEGRIYELEEKCEGFDIGERQLWESIDSAFGAITNLKEKYNENSNYSSFTK